MIRKVHRHGDCEFWYDTTYRVWFAAHVDAEGNLGPSIDAATREEIVMLVEGGFCEPAVREA